MTKTFPPALIALGMLLSTALPVPAQTAPKVVGAADIASAVIRQDGLTGVYEALEVSDTLFVASSPAFDAGTPGYLDLLDADDLHSLRRIELPRRAFALAYDAKSGRLYVGNTLDGSLNVVDAKSGLLLDTVQLGKPDGEGFEHTRMVVVSPEDGRVYVSSPSDTGTLWVVDPAAGNAVTRTDNAGLWTAGVAHDVEEGRVFTGGGGMEEIGIFDDKTGARTGSFSTGDAKDATKEGSAHFFVNVALDAAGNRLFAADANTGQLYVFDTETGDVTATVPIGTGTLDVEYADDADRIFVTYRGTSREEPAGKGGMVVIDADDLQPLLDIRLSGQPNSLSVGDDGKALFLTVKAPHDDTHPDYREGGTDSVLRFDLEALEKIGG